MRKLLVSLICAILLVAAPNPQEAVSELNEIINWLRLAVARSHRVLEKDGRRNARQTVESIAHNIDDLVIPKLRNIQNSLSHESPTQCTSQPNLDRAIRLLTTWTSLPMITPFRRFVFAVARELHRVMEHLALPPACPTIEQ